MVSVLDSDFNRRSNARLGQLNRSVKLANRMPSPAMETAFDSFVEPAARYTHLSDGSYIAEVAGSPKSHRRGPIRLRAIDHRLPGSGELYRVVTTIVDRAVAPAKDVAIFYREPWERLGSVLKVGSVDLV